MTVITVTSVDFNAEDGIRTYHDECGLCLEEFKTDFAGIPVISGTMGLIRVCQSCWACGYVAVNLDKLEELVKTCETVEVTEIHVYGEYKSDATFGRVITNTDPYRAQVWAIGTNGENPLICDVTDEKYN